jgi:putative hemolysin
MSEIIIVFICLFLNAIFAAYEMAFISVPRSELKNLAKSGIKEAQTILCLRENPERTLSIIQIGITLVGSIAAAVGGVGAGETIEPFILNTLNVSEGIAESLSVMIVVIPITYLNVVVGELVPKSLALRNPIKITLKGARTLLLADKILSPVVSSLELSTKFLLKIFFPKSKTSSLHHDEKGHIEIDSLSPLHQKFMINLANIEEIKIKDIFIPWYQVTSVQENSTIQEILQITITSGHTRIPVTNLNNQIVGILHTKEFMALKETDNPNWKSILRTAILVHPNDSALNTLKLLQDKKNHLSVVTSPSNQTLGIVTLEDIFEEIIGEIHDEDDDGKIGKIYTTTLKAKGKLRR